MTSLFSLYRLFRSPLRPLVFLCFAIIWCMPLREVNSCGYYAYPEDFRFWLFQPALANISTLQHFSLISNGYYQPGGQVYYASDLRDTVYYAENIEEWRAALGGLPAREDIRAVLYHLDPIEFAAQYPHSLSGNSFVRALQWPENSDLDTYLRFAKQCEQVMNIDPWAEKDDWHTELEKTLEEGERLAATARHPFVQLRTAYQRLKLHHYLGQGAACIDVYDREIEPVKTDSWIKPSALYYKACALEGDEMYYLLTRVFDQSRDKRLRSVMLLHESPERWADIWALTRSDHEKAVLLTMQELRNPGRSLEKIRNIYALDPAYADFGILLEREINKLEDWIMTPALTDYAPALDFFAWDDAYAATRNWESDMVYLREVRNFVAEVVADGRQRDKAFLLVSAGWLSLLSGDYVMASSYIDQAMKIPGVPANTGMQIRLSALLNEVLVPSGITPKAEQAMLDFFLYLDAQKTKIPEGETFRSQVALLLAEKCIEKGEVAMGILFHAQSRRDFGTFDQIGQSKTPYHRLLEVAEPGDYEQLLQVIQKKNQTPLEKYLLKNPVFFRHMDWRENGETGEWEEFDPNEGAAWNPYLIQDYQAMWYINRDQLDSAYAILRTIPDTFWNREPYLSMMRCNPFHVDFFRPHQYVPADSVTYNKTAFLKRLLYLRREADRNPAVRAHHYYLIANAYYNMTWHGNVWLMNRVWWSTNEGYYYAEPGEEQPLTPFEADYYGAVKAREWYLKALEATRDKKMAALCVFMAGKCEDHFQYASALRRGEADDFQGGKNPYLGKYKSKFRNMSALFEMQRSCSVYQDFISRY